MRKSVLVAAGFVTLATSAVVWAADIFVYPKEGQSAEQQATDEAECRSWATSETGFNPDYAPSEEEAGKGKVAKNTAIGAAGGAAGGAVLGEVIGDRAGLGALAGGALGGYIGHRKGKDSKEDAQEAVAAEEDAYNRALSACLEGRGYSVS